MGLFSRRTDTGMQSAAETLRPSTAGGRSEPALTRADWLVHPPSLSLPYRADAGYVRGGFLDEQGHAGARWRRDAYRREARARSGDLTDDASVLIKTLATPCLADLLVACQTLGDKALERQYFEHFPLSRLEDRQIDMIVDSIEALALSFPRRESSGSDLWCRPSDDAISAGAVRMREFLRWLVEKRARQHAATQRENRAARDRERTRLQQEADRKRTRLQEFADSRRRALEDAARESEALRRHALETGPKYLSDDVARIAHRLPVRLERIHSQLRAAEDRFQRRAFSPFWEEIESLYIELGELRADLDKIRMLSDQHVIATNELASEAWFDGVVVVPKPVPDITPQLTEVLTTSSRLVSSAECDFEFAQIWELRRNTAAVVNGFSSMDMALRGMQSAVTSSFASMSLAITAAVSAATKSDRRAKRPGYTV